MSDRAFLFLFSVFMIVASVATAVWLVASGQAATVDGLFLVITALLMALAFALYVMFLIRRAMAAAAEPAASAAKSTAAKTAAKPAPATVSQS
jgi:hypothetical protein